MLVFTAGSTNIDEVLTVNTRQIYFIQSDHLPYFILIWLDCLISLHMTGWNAGRERGRGRMLLECVHSSASVQKKMWMFVASLASSPSVSRVVLLLCRLFPWPSRPPSSCILVSSRLSLRGGLSDLPPAPLFRPQSSTSSPQTSVRVTGERMATFPRHPTPPPILPLCSSSLTCSLTFCVPNHDTLPPPPPSPVILSRCTPPHPPFPSALTFNCSPVLFFPPHTLYPIFTSVMLPLLPLPPHLFLFFPLLFPSNLWQLFPIFLHHSFYFCPLFLLSAVTSNSQTRSSLLSCFLYSVFPQHLRSLARSVECFFFFFTSLRTVQRRPSGSHP